VSNAAVLMFGGIETTEGMIVNAIRHLLGEPEAVALVLDDADLLPNAIEESIRLEPAAAVVDRYATCDVELASARIRCGDLVSVSIAGANRDPAVFADPSQFNIRRANVRLNLAFALGPHWIPTTGPRRAAWYSAKHRRCTCVGLSSSIDKPCWRWGADWLTATVTRNTSRPRYSSGECALGRVSGSVLSADLQWSDRHA
jgi:hypothetical protein